MGNIAIKSTVTQKSPLTLAFEGFLLYENPVDIKKFKQKNKNIEYYQIQTCFYEARENMRNLHFRKFISFRSFALENKIPDEVIKIVSIALCSRLFENEAEAERNLIIWKISFMISK